MEYFHGYLRDNGEVGVRNHLLILSSTIYANEVVNRATNIIKNSVGITHPLGRCQTRPDLRKTFNTLVGTAKNPNIGGVIVVEHYKEEGCTADQIANEVAKTGKPVETVNINQVGGTINATREVLKLAVPMQRDLSKQKREKAEVSKLIVGLNCGTSDTTSGLGPNPALGICSDMFIEKNARTILAETTELIGGEEILEERAENEEVVRKIYEITQDMENMILETGEDIRGSQPTGDNMKGGLSTLEEKSLGAIKKSGSKPIKDILNWAEKPKKESGLYIMDTPGHGGESITGIAAGGAQVLVFTTGGGHTIAHPIMPTIKITSNINSWEKMKDTMELDLTGLFEEQLTMEDAAKMIYDEILEVSSGKLTKCEILNDLTGFAIARDTPSV